MSSTQELILLTLFIIRPVSSDQTDFMRDSRCLKGTSSIHKIGPSAGYNVDPA